MQEEKKSGGKRKIQQPPEIGRGEGLSSPPNVRDNSFLCKDVMTLKEEKKSASDERSFGTWLTYKVGSTLSWQRKSFVKFSRKKVDFTLFAFVSSFVQQVSAFPLGEVRTNPFLSTV